jgi:dihydrofolate synthase/folylpolyglutamate synthase
MNFAEAIEHLYGLAPELAPPKDPTAPRRKFDLAHMRRLCAALGDPQNQVPSVLIAGTNGKGSTASTLANILSAAGYRTGLYTSPHLTRVNERIQLSHPVLPGEYGASVAAGASPGADGPLVFSEIPDDRFAARYTQVEATANRLVESGGLPFPPSFFERLTAIAFLFFADSHAEIMILEVGLGGRLDATNVVNPLLSVITDIALDHQDYLGNTIAEIAAEKCGILRPAGTLITLPQLPEANHAIGIAASAMEVRAINAAPYIPAPERSTDPPIGRTTSGGLAPASGAPHNRGHSTETVLSTGKDAVESLQLPRNRYTVTLEDGSPLHIDSPLPGRHQQRNLALAITAVLELRQSSPAFLIPNEAIQQGIRETHWPGRLEFLPPNLLLDVAHNPAGAWTLRSALASLPPQQPRTLIFSCLRDKSLQEMSRILFPLFDSSPDADPARRRDHILLAPIANPRAADVADLLAAAHSLGIPAHAAPHLAGALAQARQITPPGGLIVATGSVYLVGELRHLALAAAHNDPHALAEVAQ